MDRFVEKDVNSNNVADTLETLSNIVNVIGYITGIIIFFMYWSDNKLLYGILYGLLVILSFSITVYVLKGLSQIITYLKIISENTKR